MAANTQLYPTSSPTSTPTGANAADCRSEAIRPVGPTPTTITRYPALSGCPDLTDHAQVVEAIGYADRARRLSKRQRWTRIERMAINAAVAYTQADAQTSHARALAIWADIQQARGESMLSDAQDAEMALAGSERAA